MSLLQANNLLVSINVMQHSSDHCTSCLLIACTIAISNHLGFIYAKAAQITAINNLKINNGKMFKIKMQLMKHYSHAHYLYRWANEN